MAQIATTKSKSNLSLLAERPIDKNIVFGIDVGIASCGWAVIDTKNELVLAMGSRCFETPEDPKTKTLYNEQRRTKRGMRRVTSRRAGRMNTVRQVIKEAGLIASPTHEYFQALGKKAPDPWEIRALAVEEAVTPDEAAVALIHIAKHRGFKSNSKRDAADSEGKVVLNAVSEWDKKLDGRTFGKAVYEDHKDGRKRNREGDYQFTASRTHTSEEARKIIANQRTRGAEWATEEFEEDYINAAFHQRPLQSSEDLVGECPFEPNEKRAAKFSYSFEKFRLLQTLINRCKISTRDGEVSLTPRQLKRAIAEFGKQKTLSYTRLRSLIDLPDARFAVIPDNDPDKLKKDVTSNSNGACPGSYTLFRLLGTSTWNQLTKTPKVLDQIAATITFNESVDEIRKRLESLDLEPETVKILMDGVNDGKFASFKGTGNLSAKAARKLIPELLRGRTYDKACDDVGYDHAKSLETSVENIKNPVVQRALTQAMKQIEVLVRCYGRPLKIHVELMREVGKSAQDRADMERGLNKQANAREKSREEFLSLVPLETCSRDELRMYELLKEQQYRCPYCDRPISPMDIVQSNAQIDHIYPRSRSHEDGFVNKVLTCISCNQAKRNRTPWEWRGEHDSEWWTAFEARVKGTNCKAEKKRRLLSTSFKDRQQDFIERNKVDNSYTSRALHSELMKLYPESYSGGTIIKGARRHIYPRPGQFTAMLRRAWLSGRYKKDRDDDRHHAMDALIVATLSEGLFQDLTRVYKDLELLGKQHKTTPKIDPPWASFAQDVMCAYNSGWLVCRTENRRARGALHEETIRSSRINENGKRIFYERKSIDNLTKSDIQRIPDLVIRTRVERWINEGKPDDHRPCSAKDDPIRKLRLPTKINTATQINRKYMGGKDPYKQGGYAENSGMVRVDLFKVNETKYDPQGIRVTPGYYLVPVYLWQVADKSSKTPLKAIVGGKQESDWPEMDPRDFVFAIYKDSLLTIYKKSGEVIRGYYRGTDRAGGKVDISPHNKRQLNDKIRGIGVKTLASISKQHVDRLGIPHNGRQQNEIWPGYQYDA